jgi:hypothetical protein
LLCLQALALEFGERADASHDGSQVAAADNNNNSNNNYFDSTFYEITIATVDQPKLLSRLSDAMVRRQRSRAACSGTESSNASCGVARAVCAAAAVWVGGANSSAVPCCSI